MRLKLTFLHITIFESLNYVEKAFTDKKYKVNKNIVTYKNIIYSSLHS